MSGGSKDEDEDIIAWGGNLEEEAESGAIVGGVGDNFLIVLVIDEDCVREWKNGNPTSKVSEPVPLLRFLYELYGIMNCRFRSAKEKLASNFADIVAQMAQNVPWKWNHRITRLLIQCLESSEYMEIRNALIMLTNISGVFPVTRKSGINLEKRVAKIKGDEREDLKVLATGVAAALAARKPSWVTLLWVFLS
ncbi:hypothetical protein L6164_001419 [Bauhinia variegata]|uniref:Uncharacterized protein n=1 Tax=Bauhinia variegata TaxID=167791 RepID=A0ACB9Q9L4_BAUVA|nr:hypothetical protein L6164_001419 [Bauhinia variegata]